MAVKFKQGDFIKFYNKPSSFGIYEGKAQGQYPKYSLVAYFDPSKYSENEDGSGWSSKPVLDASNGNDLCEKRIDTDEEDYFWKLCNAEETKAAIDKLAQYNLKWDENLLALIDKNTGEILHQIIQPKLEYDGTPIKPMKKAFKSILKNYIKSQTSYSSYQYPYRRNYEGYYEYYD